MNILYRNISTIENDDIIEEIEKKYNFSFPKDFIEFFKENNGGVPTKKEIVLDGDEYEIRCFLSFNKNEYNNIEKPLEYFQNNTHGKIVPFAKDSGDNYYCINIENLSVYYWDKEENQYFILAKDFVTFLSYLN